MQRITLSCSRNHRITSARCRVINILILLSKNSYYFLTKKYNDIKTETNKTPTTATDLKRESRLRYTKIWIYSISLRKDTLKVFQNKKHFKTLSKTVLTKSSGKALARECYNIFFNKETYSYVKLLIPRYHTILL